MHVVAKLTLVVLFSYLFSDYLFAASKQDSAKSSTYMRHVSDFGSDSAKRASKVVGRAHELIGTPYRWGGTSVSSGFDCSGLLVYLFRSEAGINLPRTTKSMLNSKGKNIARHSLQTGDAVFFRHNGRARLKHVGIYIGNNRFIHSPRTGKSIRIDSLSNTYWNKSYLAAKRFH